MRIKECGDSQERLARSIRVAVGCNHTLACGKDHIGRPSGKKYRGKHVDARFDRFEDGAVMPPVPPL